MKAKSNVRWPCFICGEETHDNEHIEVRGFRRGFNPWVCAKHVAALVERWRYLFPESGYIHTQDVGIEIPWDSIKRLDFFLPSVLSIPYGC